MSLKDEVFSEQCRQLAQDFRESGEKARTGLAKAIEKGCILVERTAKKKISRGRNEIQRPGLPPRVDTGRLRASITHRIKSNSTSVYGEVGTNVDYAVKLEFGTSKMPEHPFLTPSLNENLKAIDKLIYGEIADAVDPGNADSKSYSGSWSQDTGGWD